MNSSSFPGVRNVIDEMLRFFGSPAKGSATGKFYDAMFFVFTKVDPQDKFARSTILKVLGQLQDEFAYEVQESEDSLHSRLNEDGNEQGEDRSLKKVLEKATLRKLAVERLQAAVKNKNGPWLLSRPDSARSCEDQRNRIREAVQELVPVKKNDLNRAVKRRETHNHQVLKNLVNLLMLPSSGGRPPAPQLYTNNQSFVERKRHYVSSLKQLGDTCDRQRGQLIAQGELIARNWEAERDRMVAEKEEMIKQMQASVGAWRTEKDGLQCSTKEVGVFSGSAQNKNWERRQARQQSCSCRYVEVLPIQTNLQLQSCLNGRKDADVVVLLAGISFS